MAQPRIPMDPIHCPKCGHDITEVGLQAIADVVSVLQADVFRLQLRRERLERERAEVEKNLRAMETVYRYRVELDPEEGTPVGEPAVPEGTKDEER